MTCNTHIPKASSAPCAPTEMGHYLPVAAAMARLDALITAAADQLTHGDDRAGTRRAHDLLTIAGEQLEGLREAERARHSQDIAARINN